MSTRAGAKRGAHWFAVGGVALLTLFFTRVAADQLGDKLPALRQFRNYITKSEGA